MSLTMDGLFANPDHYLFAFDGGQAVFRAMDRDSYRRSIFLDRRISAASDAVARVPVDALTAFNDARGAAPPRTGWIFHVAHCGSTLLARALDRPHESLVLREPLALRQLGVDHGRSADWRARLRLAAALLGRRYRADAPAIVKANVPVNFIASDLLALDPAAPAIFLYFPLRSYLLAILRSDGHRTWVGNVTAQLQPAIGDISGLDASERAAALWLAQMRIYADLLARLPQARSLDAETLFSAPRPAIAAAAAHLGVAIADSDLDAIVAGEIFGTYSKAQDLAFDNDARLKLQTEAARALGPEIDRARRWVDDRLACDPLPARLDRPLVGSSPDLLA